MEMPSAALLSNEVATSQMWLVAFVLNKMQSN